MGQPQGFFYPRTATGRAALIPSPPWFYSGDLLTVEYRTDPARVAELLPAPLELGAGGPGRGRLHLGGLAVLLRQPRGAARPGALAVQGGVRRRALLVPGPDLLALRLHLGRQGLRDRPRHPPGLPEEARLDLADPSAPVQPRRPADRRRAAMFGATLAAGDRRLADVVLTLREESETNGFVNGHPMAHHRVLPGIEAGSARRVRRADLLRGRAVRGAGRRGRASRAQPLRLPDRGARPPEVDEIIGGYYRQVGVEWNGGHSLARLVP